ncbi:MAG: dCTP deaminase, partial [Candidatus Micrarchaeota archaeon]|nr:dCTP deaminase [Candidatus Micrarchaeota archaeon]
HGLVMPPTIIDAGFAGNITLEIFNSSPYAIKLKPDTRFAHVIFSMTMNRVEKAYSGRYFGQRGLTPPKPL